MVLYLINIIIIIIIITIIIIIMKYYYYYMKILLCNRISEQLMLITLFHKIY